MGYILKFMQALAIASGCALYAWFFRGPWNCTAHSLVERDAIRFGRVPALLVVAWSLFTAVTLFASLMRRKRKDISVRPNTQDSTTGTGGEGEGRGRKR